MTSEQYREREKNLRTLGYASYQAYLLSPVWRYVRGLVMKRARGSCESCRINKAVHVHHTSYSKRVLLGHRLKSLVAVCNMCHEMAHEAEFDKSIPEPVQYVPVPVWKLQPRNMNPRLVVRSADGRAVYKVASTERVTT
jgi:hypothetical protein